jgi:hypothetical protein
MTAREPSSTRWRKSRSPSTRSSCAKARRRACVCTEPAGGCTSRAHRTPRCSCCRCAAGDKGNNFYVIKEGTAEVTLTDASGTKHVRTLSAGNSCGELSLLTGEPRSATVQATSDTLVLLMVNRRMFYARIGDAILRKRARWKDFIRDLPAIGAAPPRRRTPSRPAGRPPPHALCLPPSTRAACPTHVGAEAAPCRSPVLPPRAAAPLPDTHPLPCPLPRPPPGQATRRETTSTASWPTRSP